MQACVRLRNANFEIGDGWRRPELNKIDNVFLNWNGGKMIYICLVSKELSKRHRRSLKRCQINIYCKSKYLGVFRIKK